MARGVLTDEVKQLSKELFGYDFTVRELRLLPYLMHCLLDNTNIDVIHITAEERAILMGWQKTGFLERPSVAFAVSGEFYDKLCKMLKIGYCSEMLINPQTAPCEPESRG